MIELHERTVVILARQVSAGAVSDLWLVRNGIADEDDVEQSKEKIVTPVVSQFDLRDFALAMMPDRIQVTLKPTAASPEIVVRDRIGALVAALPNLQYTAVGLNFRWIIVPPAGISVAEFTRTKFPAPNSSFFRQLSSDETEYGVVVTRTAFDSKMTVDVRPAAGTVKGVECAFVYAAFNFHYDIEGTDKVADIREALAKWPDLNELSAQLAASIEQ